MSEAAAPCRDRNSLVKAAEEIVKESNKFFQESYDQELEEERENQRLAHTVINLLRAEEIDWQDRQRKDKALSKEWQEHIAGRSEIQCLRTSRSRAGWSPGTKSRPGSQPGGNNFVSLLAAKKAAKLLASRQTEQKSPKSTRMSENDMVAIELLKKQLRTEPESRNTLALEIGQKYKEIGGTEKAAEYFVIATRRQEKKKQKLITTSEAENEKRKLERMTKEQRAQYLKKREEEEQSVQRVHRARQQQAWHTSHREAFQAFLVLRNSEKALEYMEKWVAIFKTNKDKLEAYRVVERSLSEYELLKSRDRSFSNAIRHQSLSILDDYHIKVLNILLAEEPANTAYLNTIGILYTRLQAFDHGSSRFREYANLADRKKFRDLPEYRTEGYYHIRADKTKHVPNSVEVVSHWQQDNNTDIRIRNARDDYTFPGENHVGSGTVIYNTPTTGWDQDSFEAYHKMKQNLKDLNPPVLGKYVTDNKYLVQN